MTTLGHRHIVLCSGASKGAIRRKKDEPEPLILDYRGNEKIRMRLPDFVRSIGTVPPRVLDLLEIAGYIFAADRHISRGTTDSLIYDSWSRSLHFVIKVRDVEFWNNEKVKSKLIEFLLFITGDRSYQFEFRSGHSTDRTHLFDSEEFFIAPSKPHNIMLFSGGLDSLAGALENLHESSDILCLISHKSGQPSTASVQNRLAEALKRKFPDRIKHYSFSTGLTNKRAASETQRSRTFLYGSIAFALAIALKQTKISFYENGITSLNFPRRQDLLNSRASRTTHPKTMHLLKEFLSLVAGEEFSVENKYRWKTKADVMNVIKAYKHEALISSAVTCSRTSMVRDNHSHCGGCLQCVDRRFSASAAGLSDFDHPGLYAFDFLKDSIEGEARAVVIDYARLGLQFKSDSQDSFYDQWLTEISDALLPNDREDEFVEKMFTFVKRFGDQTVSALEMFAHNDDVTKQPVPGSLLHIIQQRDYLRPEPERLSHKLAERLKRAIPIMFSSNHPKNENDFNDKIQGLLQNDSNDYRREFPATTFGMAKVIPDHEIQKCNLLIESKYLREKTPASKITDEIASDLVKYPKSAYIVFLIYDPYRSIRDDIIFTQDIERVRGCMVVIIR